MKWRTQFSPTATRDVRRHPGSGWMPLKSLAGIPTGTKPDTLSTLSRRPGETTTVLPARILVAGADRELLAEQPYEREGGNLSRTRARQLFPHHGTVCR